MMDDLILCNATAISATAILDEDCDGLTPDRLVTLALGCTYDDTTSEMIAGLILTPTEARDMAAELLTAATLAEGVDPLPCHDLTAQPAGRC